MKVYEIITEAPEYTSPGGIVIPSGAKTADPIPVKPSQPTPAKPAKTPNIAARANTAIKQRIQGVSDLHKKVVTVKNASPKRMRRVEALWKNKYGLVLSSAAGILGLAVALTDLYTELDIADELHKNEEISDTVLEQYREWSFGRFSAQMLAPAVIKLLSRAVGITFVIRMIKNTIGIAGGFVSGGATTAAALASEGMFLWLRNFLGSPTATEWLTNDFFMPIVRTMGKIPEGAWSSLTGYYEKSNQAKKDAAKSTAGTAPGAAPGTSASGAKPPASDNDEAEKLIKKLGI